MVNGKRKTVLLFTIYYLPSLLSEPGGDGLFGLRADDAVDDRAVLEDEHGRDAAYVVLGRGARVLVDVQFGDAVAAIRFRRQFVEHRRDHAARAAPFGPVIHQDGDTARLQDLARERLVGHRDGPGG